MVKQHSPPPLAPPSDEGRKHPKGPTAVELGEQIGHKLREMFNDVVTEPVPEKFQKLLEELERKSSKG
jgi:hypothetical protein